MFADKPIVPVRLAAGPTNRIGHLEVFAYGIWGLTASLTDNGATVACRQMFGASFRGVASSAPIFFPSVPYGMTALASDVVWRDGDSCAGRERSFLSCSNDVSNVCYPWPYYDCLSWETRNTLYQVACYDSTTGEQALTVEGEAIGGGGAPQRPAALWCINRACCFSVACTAWAGNECTPSGCQLLQLGKGAVAIVETTPDSWPSSV